MVIALVFVGTILAMVAGSISFFLGLSWEMILLSYVATGIATALVLALARLFGAPHNLDAPVLSLPARFRGN